MSENNEPLFCLADVAKALGYSNPAKAVIDHCKGGVLFWPPTQSGVQANLLSIRHDKIIKSDNQQVTHIAFT